MVELLLADRAGLADRVTAEPSQLPQQVVVVGDLRVVVQLCIARGEKGDW